MDRPELLRELLLELGTMARRQVLSPVNRSLRGEALALHHLCCSGSLRPRDLCEALSVTPPRVAAILDGLEAKGHITRSAAPGSRKQSLIAVTDAGRAQDAENAACMLRQATALLEPLEDGELETLITVIRKLKAAEPGCGEEKQC